MLYLSGSCIIAPMPTKVSSGRGIAPRYVLIALATILAVVSGFGAFQRGASANPHDPQELRFLELINDYRQDNGVGKLVLSDALTVASERHSADMAKYGFFAHDTVESSYYPAGSEPWDRMAAEGYDYPDTYRGENLAVGYETAEQVFEAWRNSPSHNAAMLDDNYVVVGIARVNDPGSRYGWYWTTDFGGKKDPTSHAPGEKARPAAKGDGNGIENGEFDDAGVWRQEARDDADLILKSGKARLGDYNDGVDDLRQKLRVREGAKLTYKVRVESEERRPVDRMSVRVLGEKGRELGVLATYDAGDAGGWKSVRSDLTPFAGRTVYLSFFAETDGSNPTTFYIDRVGLVL